jgi:hypothetical protein
VAGERMRGLILEERILLNLHVELAHTVLTDGLRRLETHNFLMSNLRASLVARARGSSAECVRVPHWRQCGTRVE